MRYPILPARSRKLSSQQYCTEFRGILRRSDAPLGRWYDARNLSAKRWPAAGVRAMRWETNNIDGNQIRKPIIAMVGGERPVLLDDEGNLHCGGHSVDLNDWTFSGAVHWDTTVPAAPAGWTISVRGLNDTDPQGRYDYPYMPGQSSILYNHSTRTIRVVCTQVEQIHDELDVHWKVIDGTDVYNPWAPGGDNGLMPIIVTATPSSGAREDALEGWEFALNVYGESMFTPGTTRLIRMGSRVIAMPEGRWADVVKLAAGTFVDDEEVDKGSLRGWAKNLNGESITLTMCDIDGNAYSGVTVSASEPSTHTGYWLDTSTGETALREWSASQSVWVRVESTFIKIGPLAYPRTGHVFAAGDTVNMTTDDAGDLTELLTGPHYLYNVLTDEDGYTYLVISGIMQTQTATHSQTFEVYIRPPDMDFVVECGNRLWGCRYDEANSINEIYASKLGDAANWEVYQGLSTDSWRASRGRPAPYTGAAVLGGCPLFFREDSLEKIFPSASGAHHIATYDLEGVLQGSADSLCVIGDRLYYLSRQGVMVYTGTLPQLISGDLGYERYKDGSAARDGNRYCLAVTSTYSQTPERVVLVYDIPLGIWHEETEAWYDRAITWEDRLYYVANSKLWTMHPIYNGVIAEAENGVEWYAVTAPLSYVTEHKWISYLRIRAKLHQWSLLKVYLQYDDGSWQLEGQLSDLSAGTKLGTNELVIFPRRCDHIRIRLEGTGGCEIQSIAYRLERASGGH